MTRSSVKTPLRFLWSRRGRAHIAVVKTLNAVLKRVPLGLKYQVSSRVRRNRLPYSVLGRGDTVIQVGAPSDTLHAGRQRAMSFALAVGEEGEVLVVEPDATSTVELRRAANQLPVGRIVVVQSAAWNEPTELVLRVDPSHPAANFVEGTADYQDHEVARFEEVKVAARRLDDLVEEHGLAPPTLISITTNGAERQVLEGARSLIETHAPYVALARTDMGLVDLMDGWKYEFVGDDDRGWLFKPRQAVPE